jgi:hypothetical protein
MPELIEISGIDCSQGLPTPDGTGDLGQADEKTPFIVVAIGGILFSGVLGAFIGGFMGLLFSRKFTWESVARGAAIAGTITTIRVIREGMDEQKKAQATVVNLVI